MRYSQNEGSADAISEVGSEHVNRVTATPLTGLTSASTLISDLLLAIARFYYLMQPYFLRLWLVGLVVLSVRLGLGFVSLNGLRRQSFPVDALVAERSRNLAQLLGLCSNPSVLIHSTLKEPIVVGLCRSAVVLPHNWLMHADSAQLDAILAHELAHIRRGDLLLNLVQRLVEILFFYHPAVSWISNRIRFERERCADALAVKVTGNPLALAIALQTLANSRFKPSQAFTLSASLGGGNHSLLSRIQELLGMTPARPHPRKWPLATIPCLAGLAVAVWSLGLSQEPVPAPGLKNLPFASTASSTETIRERIQFKLDPRVSPSSEAETDVNPGFARDPDTQQINFAVHIVEIAPGMLAPPGVISFTPQGLHGRTALVDTELAQQITTQGRWSPVSKMIQAPKITTMAGEQGSVTHLKPEFFVTALEPIIDQGVAFKPTVEKLNLGSEVEMSARFIGEEMELSVQLKDLDLARVEKKAVLIREGNHDVRGHIQIPHTISRDLQVQVKLIEGQTLLASLGEYPREWARTGAFWRTLGILKHLGGPELDVNRANIEKLVLITPRRILTEVSEEKQPDQVGGRTSGNPEELGGVSPRRSLAQPGKDPSVLPVTATKQVKPAKR